MTTNTDPKMAATPMPSPRTEIRHQSAIGPFLDSLRLLIRDRFVLVSILIVAIFVIVAAFAPYIAPHGPFEAQLLENGRLRRLDPPSREYWLGTTAFGHDVFSQLIYGSRVALMVGLVAAFAVGIISTLVGVIAGYFGGRLDDVLMRITDVALSIPTLPFAIVAVGLLGPSVRNIILVIILLFWRNGARIIRSTVLTERERVYVKWARAAGASHLHVIFKHILPNILRVVFLWITMSVAFSVLTEASLSFIGLGDPMVVSWGQMLNTAFASGYLRHAWWWVVPPSLALIVLISSLYLIGRGYEELTNPRLRRK